MKNMVRLVSPYDSSHAYGPNMETAFLVQSPEELIEYMQSCFKDKTGKTANAAEFSNQSWLSWGAKPRHIERYGFHCNKGFMSLYQDLKEAFETNAYFEVQLKYCWMESTRFPDIPYEESIKGAIFRGHVVDRI